MDKFTRYHHKTMPQAIHITLILH